MLFEKEMKRVNIFVDMDAKLVKGRETREESGSKRAEDELEEESSKRQKVVDDDKEKEDLKQCFEIVPDEEFVVHAIPLAVKPAPIIGFQIHRAGRFENMHIYMLVEKRYPLSPTTITDMLNRKMQADYWNETYDDDDGADDDDDLDGECYLMKLSSEKRKHLSDNSNM
ncbi:hypothetical protein Tco_0922662 [Tanacetum coccineum]|uniref:Uncharacterized protein n=1 Tax=Tanacetum coccineum TaxID=301880 RepID=A0ABQ5CZS0_9ASTR